MNAKEFLLEAANVLETSGWVQGKYKSEEGAHCAVGALNEVFRQKLGGGIYRASREDDPKYMVFNKVYNKAYDQLSECVGDYSITSWNDTFGRTAEEVISAMRACANGDSAEAPTAST